MTLLAAIWFASPWMLLGVAAVVLPIAAHLMRRRATRRIVFPSVRLLAACVGGQSRLHRWRRIILLALRCLALVALAAAFAQPGCSHRGDAATAQEPRASVVIVLDVSASLNRQVGGVAMSHHLRAAAERVIDELETGLDQVNVVYAAARPRAMFPFVEGQAALSGNLEAARQELSRIEMTYERADLPAAVALAGRMLSEAGGQRRLVIISDMQRSNWSGLSLSAGEGGALPSAVRVTVLSVPAGDGANVALSSPRAAPVTPEVGRPMQLIVRVSNYGGAAVETRVSATLDGQPIGDVPVALGAGESREVSFEAIVETEGMHRVAFALPGDALAGDALPGATADDRAFLSLRAVRRVPVLVVGDDNARQPGSATYFLVRALSPRGGEGDRFDVRHTSSAGLDDRALASAEGVFISEIAALNENAAAALAQYLDAGGGVVWFSGAGPVEQNLQRLRDQLAALHAESSDDVLPWTVTSRRDLKTSGQSLQLAQGRWDTALLADFDARSREALMQVRFHRVWSVAQESEAAQVLLRFTDNTPALGVAAAGRGRIVLANFGPALADSDLGKHGVFVALTQSLAQYVRPREPWRGIGTVGQPFAATIEIPVGEDAGRIVVIGPDDDAVDAELTRDAQHLTVIVPRPAAPGFYAVERNGGKAADVAVNLDHRESDLRTTDATTLSEQLSRDESVAVEVKGGATETRPLNVRGTPLWHWCVLLAAVAVAVELSLLCVWSR